MKSTPALLYASTAALSAFLLFLLEPMFAKMILPLLGGAANVWITAMMFYQVMLLVGYGYAHASSALTPRRQWLLHCALSALALIALPIAIPAGWTPPATGNPAWAQVAMMALAIGAPFAILSATAPLIQRWFSFARPGDNPYVLYAFSNAGSFAALIAYPALVEPGFTLSTQRALWSGGYVLLAAAMAAVGFISARSPGALAQPELQASPAVSPAPPPSWATIGRWLALAAVPSSLMLSTTSFLSTDIASIPLLWVIPLGLYLATFIVAFSGKSEAAGRIATKYYPILLIPLCIMMAPVLGKSNSNQTMTLPLHLSAFFFAALMCHCELSRLKPDASRLTLFFFIVSLGGAIGGVFNSLVAPVIFPDIYEYPLGLAMAAALAPAAGVSYSLGSIGLALVAGACAAFAEWIPEPADMNDATYVLTYRSLLVTGALLLLAVRRFPASLGAGVASFLAAAIIVPSSTNLIFAERNFYGVNRVRENVQLGVRMMEHGTTVHGLMALDARHRLTPLGYYNPLGGLAETTQVLGRSVKEPTIAVVGLGAGEMVCNGEASWRYDFYEIDPGVTQIASDKTLFPFLAECATRHRHILGDGRLMLRQAADGAYDEVMIDAFTSDSIPVHLLTRDALSEYMRKVKPGGMLVLHLSNRYFSLAPIVAAAAHDMGLAGAARLRAGDVVEGTQLPIYGTLVVALSRSTTALEPLFDMGWARLRPVPGVAAWTDDWSNLLATVMLPGGSPSAWEDAPPPKRISANAP